MPGKDHGPSVKNPRVYEALKDKGMSKSKAAAISNKGRTHKGAKQMGKLAAKTKAGERKPSKPKK